jgi:hypothetical protein
MYDAIVILQTESGNIRAASHDARAPPGGLIWKRPHGPLQLRFDDLNSTVGVGAESRWRPETKL